MNIERGFARAIKALDRLSGIWIVFCGVKVIQHFPSASETQWLWERSIYWKFTYQQNCLQYWDCLPSSFWLDLKEALPIYFSAIEWGGLLFIGIFVTSSVIHILRGFLDDEGLFVDD